MSDPDLAVLVLEDGLGEHLVGGFVQQVERLSLGRAFVGEAAPGQRGRRRAAGTGGAAIVALDVAEAVVS
ncbi:MAG: hypothetical protein H0V12_04320, partial [Chloroflexi bacterium]|nr:hypothetical protein [Chloroflexota bacterium]